MKKPKLPVGKTFVPNPFTILGRIAEVIGVTAALIALLLYVLWPVILGFIALHFAFKYW